MKVIKEAKEDWQQGEVLRGTCYNCGCLVEFREGEATASWCTWLPKMLNRKGIKCPTPNCGKTIFEDVEHGDLCP